MNHAVVCTACDWSVPAPGSLEAGRPVCSKCFSPMVASSAPNSGETEAGAFDASLTMIMRPPARGPQPNNPTDSAVEPPLNDGKLQTIDPTTPPHEEEFDPSLTSIVRPSAAARQTSSEAEEPKKDDDFSPSLTSIIRPGAGMPPSNRDAGASSRVGSVEPATGGGTGGTDRATRTDGSNLSGGGLRVGDLLDGRYLITRRLGQGGMGVVYKAVDQETESELAIKVLLPSIASSPAAMNDLRQEVAIAQQLTHQNLLRVNHLGLSQDLAYLVMEYIDGEDLETYRLRHGGKLPEDDVRRIMTEVLDGLSFLHDRGIVHLDIKPQNIMIPRSGEAKLADFGISRTIRQQVEQNSEGQTSVGTLCFMAPEQIRGEVCDRRADLYAFGVMLHLLLVGDFPFLTRSREDVVAWHLDSQIDIVAIPSAWDAALRSCLARRKEERAVDGSALMSALSSITGAQERQMRLDGVPSLEQDLVKLLYDDKFDEALNVIERLLESDRFNPVAALGKLLCSPRWDVSNAEIEAVRARLAQASEAYPDNGAIESMRVCAALKLARRCTILASQIDRKLSNSEDNTDLESIMEKLLITFSASHSLSTDISDEVRQIVISSISLSNEQGIGITVRRARELVSDTIFNTILSEARLCVSGIDNDMQVSLDGEPADLVVIDGLRCGVFRCGTKSHVLKIASEDAIPHEVSFNIDMSSAFFCKIDLNVTSDLSEIAKNLQENTFMTGKSISLSQQLQFSSPRGWLSKNCFGIISKQFSHLRYRKILQELLISGLFIIGGFFMAYQDGLYRVRVPGFNWDFIKGGFIGLSILFFFCMFVGKIVHLVILRGYLR